jgi:acyl-CoA thioester hydrolase
MAQEGTAMVERNAPRRADHAWFRPVTARWMDNDVYGHVNNAHYYSYFDTVINRYLIEQGGLDVRSSPVVGFVVSSACDFFRPVAYPDDLEVGLRVDRIGRSSAHYGVALFTAGDDSARAAGRVVHVFVDRGTTRPVEIPDPIRRALEAIAARSGP